MTQIPRPEHPQPQMKREHWKNLNGEWDFSFDFGCSGIDQKWQEGKTDWEKKILVPFCPESDLSGIGYKDFIPGVWYHRTITLTGEELKGDLLLHFGAVDYDARVWINGVEAGRHQGGYVSFTFNITKLVKKGENDITLFAADEYFHIGTRRLRQIIAKDKYAKYLIWNGGRVFFKRKMFEEYLNNEVQLFSNNNTES